MVMKTWKCLSRFPGIPSEQFEEFELSSENAPDVCSKQQTAVSVATLLYRFLSCWCLAKSTFLRSISALQFCLYQFWFLCMLQLFAWQTDQNYELDLARGLGLSKKTSELRHDNTLIILLLGHKR